MRTLSAKLNTFSRFRFDWLRVRVRAGLIGLGSRDRVRVCSILFVHSSGCQRFLEKVVKQPFLPFRGQSCPFGENVPFGGQGGGANFFGGGPKYPFGAKSTLSGQRYPFGGRDVLFWDKDRHPSEGKSDDRKKRPSQKSATGWVGAKHEPYDGGGTWSYRYSSHAPATSGRRRLIRRHLPFFGRHMLILKRVAYILQVFTSAWYALHAVYSSSSSSSSDDPKTTNSLQLYDVIR